MLEIVNVRESLKEALYEFPVLDILVNVPEWVHVLPKDNDIKSWFEKNEYCNFVFTLSAFRDMFTVLDRVSDDNWAYSLPFELPVYILAGDMDPVGNYGKGVKQVYKRLVDAGLDDVNLKLYKNLRHEILNEPEKDIVYNDILQWIKIHLD